MYNVIWYNGANFSTVITKEMLINKGGKKINSRSNPFINIGAGFDCETSQFDHHEKYTRFEDGQKIITDPDKYRNALKSFVYIWQFSVGNDIYLCHDVHLLGQFLYDLDNACNVHNNAQLIIWDANLSFEWSYFKEFFRYGVKKIFAKTKSDILSFDYGKHLKFRECLGAFGNSLKDIAKNYTTTQKLIGDLDYDKIRIPFVTPLTQNELNYCINDVAILSELTPKAHEMYTLKNKKIPLTQTGIVRDEIMARYAPNPYIKSLKYAETLPLIGSQDEYNLIRQYVYSGGLTHSNFYYVGEKIHNITCYDLTSAYPWALNTQYYPAGEMIKVTDKDGFKFAFSHRHWFMKATVKKVESKSTHSTLSKHKVLGMVNPVLDNGRIFKADEITAYFTEIDWNNFKSIYKFDVEGSIIYEVYYFTKSARIPNKILSVMNEWYKRKTILKPLVSEEHKHDVEYPERKKEYKRLKALINSVYGMTVTSLYDKDITWNIATCEMTENNKEWEKVSQTVFNPWWGYYCTAYVRARLIECISKFPENIVQYDTDSIYCTENDDLKSFIDNINERIATDNIDKIDVVECLDLGLWDFDGFYVDFMALGSKRYIGRYPNGDIKITFAGANMNDIMERSKVLDMDIFEFIKSFSITEDLSTKNGAYHFKDYYSALVTDYMGNTAVCETWGGITIKTVDFKAKLSHDFKHLRDLYLKKRGKQ